MKEEIINMHIHYYHMLINLPFEDTEKEIQKYIKKLNDEEFKELYNHIVMVNDSRYKNIFIKEQRKRKLEKIMNNK